MTQPQIYAKGDRSEKYGFFKTVTMSSLFIYICTLFFMSYSEYNSISKAFFAFTLGLTVINFFLTGDSFKIDYSFFSLLLFVTYILISSFWVVSNTGVSTFLTTVIQLFGLFIMVRMNIQDEKDFRIVLYAVFVGSLIMCFYTIGYYGLTEIISRITAGDRIGQEINQANGMGLYCTILSLLALYFLLFEKKYWCCAVLPISLFILVGAASRKSFLLFAVGAMVLIVFKSKKGRLRRFLVVMAILLFCVYLILSLAESSLFFFRLSQVFELFGEDSSLTDGSLLIRRHMIDYGLELFTKKPVFGHGPVQFEYYYSVLTGFRRPPHSTYVQILCGYGICGFVLFYGIYVYFIKKLIAMLKANRKYSILIAMFIIIFLINDIGANMLNHKFLYMFLAIFASYISIKLNDEKTELI